MPATFEFEPLCPDQNEFRLIKLLPGSENESIRCDSFVVSLDDNPQYQALSYAWGDSSSKISIQLCGKPFCVSSNLLSALRNLRLQHEPQVLWVDSLCIDQQNNIERAWQVSLMGKIFSNCREGLLWIGDNSEESDIWCTTNGKGCRFCSHGCGFESSYHGNCQGEMPNQFEIEDHHHGWHEYRPRISSLMYLIKMLEQGKHLQDILSLYEIVNAPGIPALNHLEPLMALRAFMNRTWWTRMWTVQEAVLPPVSTLCWGKSRYSFVNLVLAANRLYSHSTSCCSWFFTSLIHKLEESSCGEATVNALFNFQKHLYTLDLARGWLESTNVEINLMDYIYNFHERKSKDPRDKIFALLGLLPEHLRFPADYRITTKALYERVSLLLLESFPDRQLSVLWRESKFEPSACTPSWVKDFNRETREFNRRVRGQHYDASNAGKIQLQKHSNGVLSFLGTEIDMVSKLAPSSHVASTYALDQFSTFRDWGQFLNLSVPHQDEYAGGGTLFQAFTKTLTGDINELDPGYQGFGEEEAEQFTKSLLEQSLPGRSLLKEKFEDKHINAALAQELNTSASGRKLFITRQGLIGLGPSWMEPGDEVWVLSGGSVPFILRPLKNTGIEKSCNEIERSQKCHIVIGDCYTHGIMFGEAIGDRVCEQTVFLK